MILVWTGLGTRISDSKAGTVGLSPSVMEIFWWTRKTAAPPIWRWDIMSVKNNASIIYRNMCTHVTIITQAVEPPANGEQAHVKKHLNRLLWSKVWQKRVYKTFVPLTKFCEPCVERCVSEMCFFKILLVWEQELLNCGHENTNFS